MTRAAIVDYDDYDTFSKLPPLRLRMTTCVSTANCDAGDQNVDGAIGLPATSTSETSSLRKVPTLNDSVAISRKDCGTDCSIEISFDSLCNLVM